MWRFLLTFLASSDIFLSDNGFTPRRKSKTTRVIYSNSRPNKSSSRCSLCSVRSFLCLLLILIGLGSVGFFLFQKEASLELNSESERTPNLDYMNFRQPKDMVSFQDIMEDNFSFNLSSKKDVMVFLHIQKTGGRTFGKHLVQDIDLERPCDCHRKRRRRKFHCDCFRPGTKDSNWLFSR